MRTHLELDGNVLEEVMDLGQFQSKKVAVNTALVQLAQMLKRKQLLALQGKVVWRGNLDALRNVRGNDTNDTAS